MHSAFFSGLHVANHGTLHCTADLISFCGGRETLLLVFSCVLHGRRERRSCFTVGAASISGSQPIDSMVVLLSSAG